MSTAEKDRGSERLRVRLPRDDAEWFRAYARATGASMVGVLQRARELLAADYAATGGSDPQSDLEETYNPRQGALFDDGAPALLDEDVPW